MTAQPLDPTDVQHFLEALDEAGEKLRELIDEAAEEDAPAIQEYLHGSTFLESGYLMVEQLGEAFPEVFRALRAPYWAAFEKTQRGQISWAEALEALPGFLKEYAQDRVASDLFEES